MKKSSLPATLPRSVACLFLLSLSACAFLHHVQVGQIDNRDSEVSIPFEIKMSEMGISTEEIGHLAKATHTQGGKDVSKATEFLALFQMGPRTGNLVYNEHYARNLVYEIYQRCPSGKVTGLMSIREMRKYPAISGEIVKVTGYCRKPRVAAPQVGSSETETHNQENLK